MSTLSQILEKIQPLNLQLVEQAQARQQQLTKPPGSLGRLEELSWQLAGISQQLDPPLSRKHIVVMAADHGVTAEGVSAYPAEVTPQMIYNFLNGGAAINVLARQIGATVTVVDMGVAAAINTNHPRFLDRKIAAGTQNIALGPAMTYRQAQQAIETGIRVVDRLANIAGLDLLMTGDMGIGNTTPSAAIVSVYAKISAAEATGRGTGVDDVRLQHKIQVVEQAVQANHPDPNDPLDVLAKVGGFEIGGIAGLMLGAAARRVPILIDGFISTAGAILAATLSPQAKDYMIAAHLSTESGHRAALNHLGLKPLLALDLRLGEGSGAALTAPLLDAAARTLNDMATFAEAGVSDKD